MAVMHRREFIALAVLSATGIVRAQNKGTMLVYFGTYTNNTKSRGIYVSRLDTATGALSAPELAAETPSPSFLAIHPAQNFLYAANEIGEFEGKKTGAVSAFSIDRQSGRLTALNQQSSGGAGPAYITVDSKGRNALVANYGGGSVAVLPIGKDGRLRAASSFIQHSGASVNPQRQKGPHAHSIYVSPNDQTAYAVDLGLDKVFVYEFDPEKGLLKAGDDGFAALEPGSGPRHLALHPKRPYAYVINEMTCKITAFNRHSATSGLTAFQTVSTLPGGEAVQPGYSTAEVQVHPSGRFLYGSNRGHDSIVVFAIDEKTGRLTHVQHEPTQGSTPRNFGIDPSGSYLLAANQRSDSVVVFRIDAQTGRLTSAGHRIEVAAPVCVKFLTSV